MKEEGCTIAFLITVLAAVRLVFGANWLIKGAFGPKYRTIKIDLSEHRTLICEETYSADFAAVFYDVKFTLKDRDNELIELGEATFSRDNWSKDLHLIKKGDWLVLPVDNGGQAKILLNNPILGIKRDTVFSSSQLRYDSLWRSNYDEIPAWTYSGQSIIDSIRKNEFYINYEYRIGLYEPFEFYNQTIGYEMNLETGELRTKTIYERKEKSRVGKGESHP